MSESTRFECVKCDGHLSVRNDLLKKYVGKQAACPNCGEPIHFSVPSDSQTSTAIDADEIHVSSWGLVSVVQSTLVTNSLLGVGLFLFLTNMLLVSSESNEISAELTRIQHVMSSMESDVSRMETDLSSMESDVSSMESDVSSMALDVSLMETDVSRMETDLSSMESDVSRMESDLSDIEFYGVKIKN